MNLSVNTVVRLTPDQISKFFKRCDHSVVLMTLEDFNYPHKAFSFNAVDLYDESKIKSLKFATDEQIKTTFHRIQNLKRIFFTTDILHNSVLQENVLKSRIVKDLKCLLNWSFTNNYGFSIIDDTVYYMDNSLQIKILDRELFSTFLFEYSETIKSIEPLG